MIIKQFSLPKSGDQSFQMRRDYFPKHQSIWHYHDEFELVYVIKGSGTLFIGDRIKIFQAGSAILIPSHTPHYWLFDGNDEQTENPEPIDCIVVHFLKDFGIEKFLQAPELLEIKSLLDNSYRGLHIEDDIKGNFEALFQKTLKANGLTKLFKLLEILLFTKELNTEELTSENYSILHQSEDQFRMNNLMKFIRANYKHKIMLKDLAIVAGMTENSFCRYFKQKTGKTPVQFINELRISHACYQLKNNKISLKEICYDSGFNNFVSFHKSFKTFMGCTPLQFKSNQ